MELTPQQIMSGADCPKEINGVAVDFPMTSGDIDISLDLNMLRTDHNYQRTIDAAYSSLKYAVFFNKISL